MNALQPVILVIVFGAAALMTSVTIQSVTPWWNGRISRYTRWVVAAYGELEEPVDTLWAQRVITASIIGPFVLFVLLGAWPIGVVTAIAGGFGPYWWVRYKRHARMQTIDNQLVDAL